MTLNTPRFPHRPPTLTPGPCPRWALNMRQTGPRPSAGLFPAQPTEGPWMVDINTKKVLVSALRTRPSRVKASTARRISQTPVLSLPPWCPSPSPHSPCPLYAALGQQQKAFKYSLLQCQWRFPRGGAGGQGRRKWPPAVSVLDRREAWGCACPAGCPTLGSSCTRVHTVCLQLPALPGDQRSRSLPDPKAKPRAPTDCRGPRSCWAPTPMPHLASHTAVRPAGPAGSCPCSLCGPPTLPVSDFYQ